MSAPFRRIIRVSLLTVIGTVAGLWLLRDRQNDTPIPTEVAVSEVAYNPAMANMRLRITLNGKRGFVDGSGQTVIAPTFVMAMPFSEGMAAVATCDSSEGQNCWQFVNDRGQVAINKIFLGGQIGTFHEGLAPTMVKGKWGYIGTTGDFAIPLAYDAADDFSEGLATIRIGRKFGVIDHRGAAVLAPTFDFIGSFRNGLALFAQGDRFGYIDRRGQVLIQPTFEDASDFSEGLACVGTRRNGEHVAGYINPAGRYVIEPQSIDGGPFHQGLAAVRSAEGAYFINKTGQRVFSTDKVERFGNFSEGLAPAMVDGLFGFVDRTGKMVIPPQWQTVGDFTQGVCRVNSADVRGYINASGQYVWKLRL